MNYSVKLTKMPISLRKPVITPGDDLIMPDAISILKGSSAINEFWKCYLPPGRINKQRTILKMQYKDTSPESEKG